MRSKTMYQAVVAFYLYMNPAHIVAALSHGLNKKFSDKHFFRMSFLMAFTAASTGPFPVAVLSLS
jgi:hypothetical protein